MKKIIFFTLILGVSPNLFAEKYEPDSSEQLVNPKKLLEEMQRELDAVFEKYEGKLDDQLEKYEKKADEQISRLDQKVGAIEERLDSQLANVEGRLDQTFNKVDDELGDVKSALLSAVGTIAWRLTIVDIITAVLATFFTAFITSFLTARKIQIEKFRKEMEAMIMETKRGMEEMLNEVKT